MAGAPSYKDGHQEPTDLSETSNWTLLSSTRFLVTSVRPTGRDKARVGLVGSLAG